MKPTKFRWGRAVIAGALVAMGATSVSAADIPSKKGLVATPPPKAIQWFDIAFSVKGVTDYNFRGISQSDRKPAIQGSAELQFYDNLFYAGVFASSVDLATKPDAEIDFYAGIRPKFGPFAFDFGFMQYYYPSERRLFDVTGAYWTPGNTDFQELYGKVSVSLLNDSLTLGANVFHAWDWLGSGATGTYGSFTAKYAIPQVEGLAISGEIGRYWLGTTSLGLGSIRLPDYTYWNAGASYTYKNVTLDLRYHDTTLSKTQCFTLTADPAGIPPGNGRSKWCGAAFVAGLSFDITASQLGVFAPR